MQPARGTAPPVTVVFAFLDMDDGGAQRLALRSARGLDPSAFRPRILCVRRRGGLVDAAEAAGIATTVLGRLERPFDVGAVVSIARWLRAAGAGVVHVSLYSRAAPYVRLAARLARVPLVVAHEHCRAAPPPRLRRWVDRALAPGTGFVAVSRADRDALVASGAPPAAVHVVYPGIDLAAFAPGDRAAARAALAWPADRPIVLVPARLHPMKRHVDLIAALPALAARVPDVWVVCAGGGPLARVLPALAAAAGGGAQVSFVGPRADMPTLMAAADVVALCSGVEGVPAALAEGQAAGRCVVATAVGGVPEVVMPVRTISGCRSPSLRASPTRSDSLRERFAPRATVVAQNVQCSSQPSWTRRRARVPRCSPRIAPADRGSSDRAVASAGRSVPGMTWVTDGRVARSPRSTAAAHPMTTERKPALRREVRRTLLRRSTTASCVTAQLLKIATSASSAAATISTPPASIIVRAASLSYWLARHPNVWR